MNSSQFIPRAVALGKRSVDIAGALAGLVPGFVLLPLVALAIKLDSPGPVLFRQLRIGRAHSDFTEMFWMYKFRSMRTDAEAATGPVWASKEDPRITRVGRFLRKSRLDELPQLINVLKGDMSLIGPRPERPGFYGKLEQAIPFFVERTYGLRPGITGLAQVYQGYDESIEDVRSKVSYDHAYALSLTRPLEWIAMDALIVWRTLGVVVGGRGQ
jgi:lipopolysaccharide/colanic/teichoic acid biosynthesis glycosyltransferase